MPTEFGYFEGEDGDNANFSVSRLGKRNFMCMWMHLQ
jgi:hypothetical protein